MTPLIELIPLIPLIALIAGVSLLWVWVMGLMVDVPGPEALACYDEVTVDVDRPTVDAAMPPK